MFIHGSLSLPMCWLHTALGTFETENTVLCSELNVMHSVRDREFPTNMLWSLLQWVGPKATVGLPWSSQPQSGCPEAPTNLYPGSEEEAPRERGRRGPPLSCCRRPAGGNAPPPQRRVCAVYINILSFFISPFGHRTQVVGWKAYLKCIVFIIQKQFHEIFLKTRKAFFLNYFVLSLWLFLVFIFLHSPYLKKMPLGR